MAFLKSIHAIKVVSLENIIFRYKNRVLIAKTYVERVLPQNKVKEDFQFKYFRNCTEKKARILTAVLSNQEDFLNLT